MVKRYLQHGYGDMYECNQAPEGEQLYVLASDCDALAAELAEARELLEVRYRYTDRLEEANNRIRALEAALRKYGTHTIACASVLYPMSDNNCNCGWQQALVSNFSAMTVSNDQTIIGPEAETKGEQG